MRGQANLTAVAVALVVLSGLTVGTVFVAESALIGASRETDDSRLATSLSNRLLAGDAPTTIRPGVLSERRFTNLSGSRVDSLVPGVATAAVAVRLDGETVFQRGEPAAGARVTRATLLGRTEHRTTSIDLAELRETTLPHRTDSVSLDVSTGPNTTLRTVRMNDRVVLHNDSGLDGEADIESSTRDPTRLAFETVVTNASSTENDTDDAPAVSAGPAPTGSVVVRYGYLVQNGATLEVVVDV